ncbi:MAG: HAD-IB family phosphatase, partial [Agriterribacter sp.]
GFDYCFSNFLELEFIADTIPLAKNAAEIIKELKNKGYVCVLVSEGFDVVANHIKNKLGFDYCFSNFLELDKSVATGALAIAECFTPGDNKEVYDKSFVLEYATKKFGIHGKNTVFVGNSPEDIPMLKNAGMGVVTSNALPETSIWADKIIPANSLESILDIAHSSVNKKSILGQKVKYTLLGAVALGTAAAGYYLYNKIKKKEEITEA